MAEVSYWVNHLSDVGRDGVAMAFLHSTEYRTQQVQSFYTAILGRTGSPAEVASWVDGDLDLTSMRIAFEASAEFSNSR